MTIDGSLFENSIPLVAAGSLVVLRFEGVAVASIEDDGDLTLWGEVYEDVDF